MIKVLVKFNQKIYKKKLEENKSFSLNDYYDMEEYILRNLKYGHKVFVNDKEIELMTTWKYIRKI